MASGQGDVDRTFFVFFRCFALGREEFYPFGTQGALTLRQSSCTRLDWSCPLLRAAHPQWVESGRRPSRVQVELVKSVGVGRHIIPVTGSTSEDALRRARLASLAGPPGPFFCSC